MVLTNFDTVFIQFASPPEQQSNLVLVSSMQMSQTKAKFNFPVTPPEIFATKKHSSKKKT